jgi:Family of unknown function (DUF6331)
LRHNVCASTEWMTQRIAAQGRLRRLHLTGNCRRAVNTRSDQRGFEITQNLQDLWRSIRTAVRLSFMDVGTEGIGWRTVQPTEVNRAVWEPFDELVPTADWLWRSLQRHCDPECCGLDAYDFSHVSVRWACGDAVDPPSALGVSDWRHKAPGNPLVLAEQLKQLSAHLRASSATEVSAALFNDILTPTSYADLFDDLAHNLTNPL